jgi:hypothetical protein
LRSLVGKKKVKGSFDPGWDLLEKRDGLGLFGPGGSWTGPRGWDG